MTTQFMMIQVPKLLPLQIKSFFDNHASSSFRRQNYEGLILIMDDGDDGWR